MKSLKFNTRNQQSHSTPRCQWWAKCAINTFLTTALFSIGHTLPAQDLETEDDLDPGGEFTFEILDAPLREIGDDPPRLFAPPSPPLPDDEAATDLSIGESQSDEAGRGSPNADAPENRDSTTTSPASDATTPPRTRGNSGPSTPPGQGVAEFIKQAPGEPAEFRPLSLTEKRMVAEALRRSQRLLASNDGAFMDGQLSLTQYARHLDVAAQMREISSDVLNRPDLRARIYASQVNHIDGITRQITELHQPNSIRWKADLLMADYLRADALFKLTADQKNGSSTELDRTEYDAALSARTDAARQLFEQRLRDYRIGWADLEEIAIAARNLIPPSTGDLTPNQKAELIAAMDGYAEVLRDVSALTERWHRSKANMGTDQFMSIFRDDGELRPLSQLGADGTGLAADDRFAPLHEYDELLQHIKNRNAPLAHEQIFPSQFDQTGVHAGAARIDRVMRAESEMLLTTAKIAELNGNSNLARQAYAESFRTANAAFQTEMELYRLGTASLSDVTNAWMAGEAAKQAYEQAGFEAPKNWSGQQQAKLSRLQELTDDGNFDTRGSGLPARELISSLQSFESVRQLKTTLQQEAESQRQSQPVNVPVQSQPVSGVQSFVPGDRNSLIEPIQSDGVRSSRATTPPSRAKSFNTR